MKDGNFQLTVNIYALLNVEEVEEGLGELMIRIADLFNGDKELEGALPMCTGAPAA